MRAAAGAGIAILMLVGSVRIEGAQDYKDCVGYTALQAELGDDAPVGTGVRVSQVEVGVDRTGAKVGWAPDSSLPSLHGKSFLLPGLPSGHATEVALRFYGSEAMARGVTEIECFPNSVWALDPIGFLRTGTDILPQVSASRIANHSWVGKRGAHPGLAVLEGASDSRAGENIYLEVLKRIDYIAATDDFVQVGGADNKREPPDVLQCSYNAIVVGKTDARHSNGTNDLSRPVYGTGRAKPDIVAPATATSLATPIVTASAAVLIGFAEQHGPAISNGSYISPRSGRTIHHAAASEVIKAALLAGADRHTSNKLRLLRDIRAYRRRRQRAANGLDTRFGAGQVNVRNSYHILAAGERDSAEDSAAGGEQRGGKIGPIGFDYDPAFGGASGSNRRASYLFQVPEGEPWLKASLVWHIKINDSPAKWDGKATLYDLDLELYDLEHSDVLPVVTSQSAADNTENIYTQLKAGRPYRLCVVVPSRQEDFLWDYALAWQIGSVPPPPATDDCPPVPTDGAGLPVPMRAFREVRRHTGSDAREP